MILKRLETGLFNPVDFEPGLNFIYAVKEDALASDESLNAVGKSLFLDLIDFGLLSYFNPSLNTRLAKAYKAGLLNGKYVRIDFELNDSLYSIKRYFDDPHKTFFAMDLKSSDEWKTSDLQKELYALLFSRKDYDGVQDDKWYRPLMDFFLKLQEVSGQKFLNPVRFTNANEDILNQYHLFLLNIDNSIASEINSIAKSLDEYTKTLKTARDFLLESYGIKEFPQVYSEISKLENQIKRIKKSLDTFKLAEEYRDLERKAAELTEEIKAIGFFIYNTGQKIKEYNAQLYNSDNTQRAAKIYFEISREAGNLIKNKLLDAVNFRKSLISSRKDFFLKEIDNMRASLRLKNDLLTEKDNERSLIYRQLAKNKAFDDLTSSYDNLFKLETIKAALQAKLDFYKQTKDKINSLKNIKGKFSQDISHLKINNQNKVDEFKQLMREIYREIFNAEPEGELFEIRFLEKEEKMKLSILPDDKFSHGKNQGRTLIYDLAVLIYMLNNNLPGPNFLIHDSIFDSLDKSYLKNLFHFIEKKQKDFPGLQYIVTLNQQSAFEDEILSRTAHKIHASERLLGVKF